MSSEKKAPCGKAASCDECPFPDCEWDGVSPEDWSAAKERDLQARHAKENKVAAQRRAYREANKEKVAAQQRAYREANKAKALSFDRLVERLDAWSAQEKGLARSLLLDVLEAAHKIEGEEMAAQMGGK